MKKAVFEFGGNQYFVIEGQTLDIELLKDVDNKTKKQVQFQPILVIDEKNIFIGKPSVDELKISAEVIEANILADKVTSIRYKAKKRVHKVRGHRQHRTQIKIVSIA